MACIEDQHVIDVVSGLKTYDERNLDNFERAFETEIRKFVDRTNFLGEIIEYINHEVKTIDQLNHIVQDTDINHTKYNPRVMWSNIVMMLSDALSLKLVELNGTHWDMASRVWTTYDQMYNMLNYTIENWVPPFSTENDIDELIAAEYDEYFNANPDADRNQGPDPTLPSSPRSVDAFIADYEKFLDDLDNDELKDDADSGDSGADSVS